MRSSELGKVMSDSYQMLGHHATIDLLDNMNRFGFRMATASGLSFATDDLITPPTKTKIIGEAEKTVLKYQKLYQRRDHEQERYNSVLDAWTHAREHITAEMMKEHETIARTEGYVNPIYLMAHSSTPAASSRSVSWPVCEVLWPSPAAY